jgi:release factor glutamine methyltransferase
MPDTTPTVRQALGGTHDALRRAGCDTPDLDAEVLLGHVLGQERAWLYAHPEQRLDAAQAEAHASLVQRRMAHEPVAYLVGHKEFFGLDFAVTPAVLVPRPETELLIEAALDLTPERRAASVVADVGTGSGIIAVTLAVHLPGARVIATDLSPTALALAHRNAVRHGVADRVTCVQADLLAPLHAVFDTIVANPPYLRTDEMPIGPSPLAWEPRQALSAGSEGLQVIRRLLALAAYRLRPGGRLIMEIGAGQGCAVLELVRAHFPHAYAHIRPDYAGLDRVLVLLTDRNCAGAPVD